MMVLDRRGREYRQASATSGYRGFFLENVMRLARSCGWTNTPVVMQFIPASGHQLLHLPELSLSHRVDGGSRSSRKRCGTSRCSIHSSPQLVAGPIERSRNLLPQLTAHRARSRPSSSGAACNSIIIGYVKKVAIADAIAPMTREAFSEPYCPQTGAGLCWQLYLFALQIYGDFSGYSDIARGCARLLGVNLDGEPP